MNPPRLLLLVLVVTCVCAGALGVTALARHPSEPAAAVVTDPTARAARPEVDAALALASWDHRRARVWASGGPVALRELYTPGSAAGRADAAMLRAWRARGLRVAGLRTQVLALDVVRRSERSLLLRVTDRVAAGSAVRGTSSITLPADRPTTRLVELRWYAGEWRVASVAAG